MVITKQKKEIKLEVPINKNAKIEISELADGCGIKVLLCKNDSGNTIKTLLGVVTPLNRKDVKLTFLSWHLQQNTLIESNNRIHDIEGETIISSCNRGRVFAEVVEKEDKIVINLGTQRNLQSVCSIASHLAVSISVDKKLERGVKIHPLGEVLESDIPFTHIEILRQD